MRDTKDDRPDVPEADVQPEQGLDRDEYLQRIGERIDTLSDQASRAKVQSPPHRSSGNKLGARKDARFKAISTAPSINWTPAGAGQVPVPYQTIQDLSNSVSAARSVKFNGSPAYLLDQTKQPKGTGDERGTGKGIRSGTVTGEVKPVSACTTVRVEGKQVVRAGDNCTMNGGNNPGIYIAASAFPSTSKPQNLGVKSLNELLAERRPESGIVELGTVANPLDLPYLSQRITLPKQFPEGQRLEAIKQQPSEAQLLRTRNSLTIALLGHHGAFGALARLSGQNESAVQEANSVGAAWMGIEGALLGLGNSSNPPAKTPPPPTGPTTSRSTGLKIKGPPTALPINKLGIQGPSYSAIKPGPLSDDLAGTFSGGGYSEFTLNADTILFRAGEAGQPLGQFFSLDRPVGILQARIDKAVLPVWPGGGKSPLDTSFSILIPAGTKVYVGDVGAQNGFYLGGTQQVVVPKPWTIQGVKIIDSEPMK